MEASRDDLAHRGGPVIMRHALMHPAYPDIVGQAAAENLANDNSLDEPRPPIPDEQEAAQSDWSEALFQLAARVEIAATRLW